MIVVGLGNGHPEYAMTRHNVGFIVLDLLREKINAPNWKEERGAKWSKTKNHLLIKPLGFMNTSGQDLSAFLQYKQISLPTALAELLVVHDDVDFPLGTVKEDFDRSSGGHNGVMSIIKALNNQAFSRLRIGIDDNRKVGLPAEEYVLQNFTKEEQPIIDQAMNTAATLLVKKLST